MTLQDSNGTDEVPRHTVSSALDLLQSLRPGILDALAAARIGDQNAHAKLVIQMEKMDIMPPERRQPDNAHVLFIGPNDETSTQKALLWDICRESVFDISCHDL
jgi:activating signal cointegrator complex subunit 1